MCVKILIRIRIFLAFLNIFFLLAKTLVNFKILPLMLNTTNKTDSFSWVTFKCIIHIRLYLTKFWKNTCLVHMPKGKFNLINTKYKKKVKKIRRNDFCYLVRFTLNFESISCLFNHDCFFFFFFLRNYYDNDSIKIIIITKNKEQ